MHEKHPTTQRGPPAPGAAEAERCSPSAGFSLKCRTSSGCFSLAAGSEENSKQLFYDSKQISMWPLNAFSQNAGSGGVEWGDQTASSSVPRRPGSLSSSSLSRKDNVRPGHPVALGSVAVGPTDACCRARPESSSLLHNDFHIGPASCHSESQSPGSEPRGHVIHTETAVSPADT